MGQDHPCVAGLVVATVAAACMMAACGGAEEPLIAGTTTRPAAAVLPRQGEPGWDSVFDDFMRSDLPKDVPLPDRTPYDGDAAKQEDYLLGYKMGFVEGVQGMLVSRQWHPDPEALLQGERAGDRVGRTLYQAREQADHNRRLGFVETGKVVGETSPPVDRAVLRDFKAFQDRLRATIRDGFPRSLQMSTRETEWRVYVYPYDDYSASNSGAFVRRTCYKGVCTVVLSVASDAEEDATTTMLKGSYHLSFDFRDGRWLLDDEAPGFLHWQQQGRAHGMAEDEFASHARVESKLPAARMRTAAEQAMRVRSER